MFWRAILTRSLMRKRDFPLPRSYCWWKCILVLMSKKWRIQRLSGMCISLYFSSYLVLLLFWRRRSFTWFTTVFASLISQMLVWSSSFWNCSYGLAMKFFPLQSFMLLFTTDSRWYIVISASKRVILVVWSVECGVNCVGQLRVVIRLLEYMCRCIILITHYCYGDVDFFSSRDRSLEKWFSELIQHYTTALESSTYSFRPIHPIRAIRLFGELWWVLELFYPF